MAGFLGRLQERANCSELFMIDNNQRALFELIKAGLWDNEVLLSQFDEIDFTEVYRLAEEQSVIGLVTAGLEHVIDAKVPQEVILTFIGFSLQLEQQNKSMNEFVAKLIEKLRNEGVYALLLKGQEVAQCYEKPLWRSCGDVDLFLSDDNYKKAKKSLVPLASSVEDEYVQAKHFGMTIDGFVVELHGNLHCPLSSKVVRGLKAIQDDTFYSGNVRSWQNGRTQIFLLSVENDIVYVFTHFLNHFYKEGVGLRQICDWCRLLWTYREKLDLRVLESRIKQMGLVSEWKAFGAYAVEYLGMPSDAMPMYSDEAKWKRKAALINDFILRVGNMGNNMDMSHFSNKPFFVRKCISAGRRLGDLFNHARIFPLDSLLFSFSIMKNGLKSAMRGEG